MNCSEGMKENPGELTIAIKEWWDALTGEWHALTGNKSYNSASRDQQNSSLNAAGLAPFADAVVLRCLGCLLVIVGAAAIMPRLAEIANSPWLLVNIVLKVVSWLSIP